MADKIEEIESEKTTNVAKCPECGANMEYSPTQQVLKCPYCGTKVNLDFSNHSQEQDFSKLLEKHATWGNEVHVYRCNNCGGKQVLNKQDIALICPFCGTSNVIETSEISGLKPNGVVPFAVDKDKASDSLIKWAKKNFWAPRALKKSISPEEIRGIYSPAFTFDCETFSHYEGRLGKEYTETRTRNGKRETVTKIRYFRISGVNSLDFDDIVVSASSKISPQTLDNLGGFNTNNSQQYDDKYLYGYLAEGGVRSGEDCYEDAKRTMSKEIRDDILRGYSYDVVDYLNVQTSYNNPTFKYLLLPIYIGHYKYRNKDYNFWINGYTAKVYGKSPKSFIKIGILALIILIVVVAILILMNQGGN